MGYSVCSHIVELKAIEGVACYIPQITIYIIQIFSLSVFAEVQTSTISKETCFCFIAILQVVVIFLAIITYLERSSNSASEVECLVLVLSCNISCGEVFETYVCRNIFGSRELFTNQSHIGGVGSFNHVVQLVVICDGNKVACFRNIGGCVKLELRIVSTICCIFPITNVLLVVKDNVNVNRSVSIFCSYCFHCIPWARSSNWCKFCRAIAECKLILISRVMLFDQEWSFRNRREELACAPSRNGIFIAWSSNLKQVLHHVSISVFGANQLSSRTFFFIVYTTIISVVVHVVAVFISLVVVRLKFNDIVAIF